MTSPFNIIIPARYASTRLPGKPLLDIAGKPMIQHVYELAQKSGADKVVIATDDKRILETCNTFNAHVCMTAPHHPSGTDRIAEVIEQLQWTDDMIVVNLQGDEPLMRPDLIEQVANDLATFPDASLSTLSTTIQNATELFDPNVVKMVQDRQGYALYFSRAPIPWDRDHFAQDRNKLPDTAKYLRHIGLYAYKAAYVKQYSQMPACYCEQAESLEQLRALWNGHRIHVSHTDEPPGHGVDTIEDLAKVEACLSVQ